jgi:hypothetical protein
MSRGGRPLAALGVAALLTACGGSPPAPPPPASPPKPVAAAPAPAAPALAQEAAATAKAASEALSAPPSRYDVRGRRDPFENLEVSVKEREATPAVSVVASAKLTGIIRGAEHPMALVETAQGMGYILKTGDTLGEGRLVEIGMEQVVFSVPPRPGSAANRVVLKIAKD